MSDLTSKEQAYLEFVNAVITTNPGTEYAYRPSTPEEERDRRQRYARMVALEALKLYARRAVEPTSALVAIARELDASFDQQTHSEKVREEFDAPDDREYSVNITAKQQRALDRAVLETHRPAEPPSEVAWLIEMQFDGKAHWWCGSDFIDDANQAVRFSRRQDADQVILERGLVDAVATEHMWCSGPTVTKSASEPLSAGFMECSSGETSARPPLSREYEGRSHRGITRDWNYVCTDNDCWCWGSEHHNPRR